MDWEVKKYPMYYGSVKQPYSKSVVVGNLIFLSGIAAVDFKTGKVPDDLEEQTILAFERLR